MPKETQTSVAKTSDTKNIASENPWHSLVQFRRDLDRMFEGISSPFMKSPFSSNDQTFTPSAWFKDGPLMPPVDIVEKDKEYCVSMEVPGMDEKDVEISASNGMLLVKGEKREEKDKKEKDYFLSERRFGSFRRTFRIPDGVDADRIQAKFSRGLIEVTLPKKPESVTKEKKIPISKD